VYIHPLPQVKVSPEIRRVSEKSWEWNNDGKAKGELCYMHTFGLFTGNAAREIKSLDIKGGWYTVDQANQE
jgi:hypothetical protein